VFLEASSSCTQGGALSKKKTKQKNKTKQKQKTKNKTPKTTAKELALSKACD